MKKKLLFYIFVVVLLIAPIVSAADLTVANSTLREFTDTAYPVELFYVVFLLGILCIILNIIFVASKHGIPASAMVIVGAIGFMVFLISAYMAPFAAKMVVVSTETEVRSVANYVFSPMVSYLCLGLASISVLFLSLGVLRYFQLLAENHKRLSNPDYQFEMYMQGRQE